VSYSSHVGVLAVDGGEGKMPGASAVPEETYSDSVRDLCGARTGEGADGGVEMVRDCGL
jgi:hypothetical protein